MATKNARPVPSSPQERAAEHQRQIRLQVWLPLGVGILLVLALAGLTIFGAVKGSSEVNRWGSLSAIYVMIPTLISSLLTVAVLVLIIRGLSKLKAKLPGWMYILQGLFARIAGYARLYADKIASPVFAVGGFTSGLKAARKKITR
jgi:hypothetical protein